VLTTMAAAMEPLGAEFEKVWDDNVDILYKNNKEDK
jgi:hypothetical protein